jgi:hypothetical protein
MYMDNFNYLIAAPLFSVQRIASTPTLAKSRANKKERLRDLDCSSESVNSQIVDGLTQCLQGFNYSSRKLMAAFYAEVVD